MKHIYLSLKERLSGFKSTFFISLSMITLIFFSSNLFAQTEELPINSAWLSPDIKNPNYNTGKNAETSNFSSLLPTVTANPNIPQTLLCSDLKVVFVLDESGSIGSSEATSVRQGATALANALLNSGATLQLIEFNTTASIINLGTTSVNSNFIANLNAYLGSGYGGKNYNPVSSGSCVGWTNWEDALDKVSGIDADLVIFFTDGNPTAYNVISGGDCEGGKVVAGVTNGESLNQAIEKANAVKAQGKHMFVVGVGPDSEINLNNIKAISGNDLFGSSNNVLTADYTRPPFSQLASDLQAAVNIICGTTISINKTASQPGVCANQFVELTTTLTNTGGDYNFDANNVVLTDVYANGYANLSIVSPASGATISGNTISYNVGTMVSGASVSIVVRAKVLAPSNSRTFKNLVTATSFNANTVKDSVSVNSGISINQIDTSNCVPISINGIEYSTTGNYSQTFDNASAAGCDSILSINFTLTDPTQNAITINECDSYTWNVNGQTYTASGTYSVVNGCNTELLNLTITPSTSNENTITSCDSYTWQVNGETYTNSGSYTSVTGCNTEILDLTIIPSSSNSTTQSSCDSYTWDVNGVTYTTSGSYTSVNNCRTEVLDLTIIASTSNTSQVSVCDTYTWQVNGETYTNSGSYTSVTGCNTEILDLTIIPSSSNSTTQSSCDSYTWDVNGESYTTSGSYTSVINCRTEVLDLTIIASTSNTSQVSVCDTYTWQVNGETYTNSGSYTSVTGCNTEILDLTIIPSSSNTTTQSSCDSYTWDVNGETYTSSGSYTSVDGCHSEILQLTITPSTKTIYTESACGSYTWGINGVTYTTSGNYVSVNGCHTDSLYLTVTYNTTSDTSANVCNSFTWYGTTYTTSGDKTYVSQTGAGCTNTATLHLTIRLAPTVGVITGPTLVCKNKTGIVYSVPASVGATSYTWTLPTGMTGSSTTNTITVATGNTFCNGVIKVTANNDCGNSTAAQLSLTTITSSPATPTLITGTTSFCTAGVYTYTVANVARATGYIWCVSGTGLSITSGQNTNTITVTFTNSFNCGSISVKASNCFGVSWFAKSISVSKIAVPTKPSSICGPSTNVCKGSNLVYSVNAVSNVTYTWTVPTGATITSGQGTNCIKVSFSPTFVGSGNISVTARNACGTSAATTLTVSALLAKPGAISGVVSCTRSQNSVQFSISSVSGATSYIWSVSGGATIVGSTTGKCVKINFTTATSSSIVISVKAVNACGTSAATTKTVTVNLTSRNSTDVTEDINAETINASMIYPNPSKGLFNFNFNTQESDKVSVKIVDVNGRIVYQSVKSYSFGNQLTKIDISSMKKGTYFLHFTRNNKVEKTLPISIQ